jgi:acyl-CoA thioesterase YciA
MLAAQPPLKTLRFLFGASGCDRIVRLKAMEEPPQSPKGEPLIRTIAMPADANPSGDIFGGWLMAQMDLTAGNAAARRARGRCVTVAVDGMVFHHPVFVGDEVSLYAEIARVGRTSLTIRVEAWRRSPIEIAMQKVTEATFTFVAINENRKPRLVSQEGVCEKGVESKKDRKPTHQA